MKLNTCINSLILWIIGCDIVIDNNGHEKVFHGNIL
jgi:hypothetical protein